MKKSLLALAVLLAMAGCSEPEAPQQSQASNAAASAESPQTLAPLSEETTESQQLTAWLDEQFTEELSFSPQRRTRLGDKTDYDKLDDVSEAAMDRVLECLIS